MKIFIILCLFAMQCSIGDTAGGKQRKMCVKPKGMLGSVFYKGCKEFKCIKSRSISSKKTIYVWKQSFTTQKCCTMQNKWYPVGSVIFTDKTDACIGSLICMKIRGIPRIKIKNVCTPCPETAPHAPTTTTAPTTKTSTTPSITTLTATSSTTATTTSTTTSTTRSTTTSTTPSTTTSTTTTTTTKTTTTQLAGQQNDPQCSRPYSQESSAWRKIVYSSARPAICSLQCDKNITPGWFRFIEPAGTSLPIAPPAKAGRCNVCQTDLAAWIKERKNPVIGEGVININFCFAWSSNTCMWTNTGQAVACQDQDGSLFYIYYITQPPCNMAYCALGVTPAAPDENDEMLPGLFNGDFAETNLTKTSGETMETDIEPPV